MNGPSYRAFRFLHPDVDGTDGSAGLRVGAGGRVDMVGREASVRQAVLLLLSTAPGERVMRPQYGCDLWRLAFAPNDDTTGGLAVHLVRRALDRWEPRVEVLGLAATRDPGAPGTLVLHLAYKVRATQRVEQVRVPVDLGGER
jgi:phage baseplate assembly protein W